VIKFALHCLNTKSSCDLILDSKVKRILNPTFGSTKILSFLGNYTQRRRITSASVRRHVAIRKNASVPLGRITSYLITASSPRECSPPHILSLCLRTITASHHRRALIKGRPPSRNVEVAAEASPSAAAVRRRNSGDCSAGRRRARKE
jgi:hypothetical protein